MEERASNTPFDPYVRWLEREHVSLFSGAGIKWRLYQQRVLIPASLKPVPVQLSPSEARGLLHHSGASLARWFTRTSDEPGRYWYVVCDRYDFDGLSGKMRTKIRRAYKDCAVRSVSADWIADHGYDCYAAAFGRYKIGRPIKREHFERIQRSCVGGPYSFFCAFIGQKLVGFAKCVTLDDYVAMVSFRIHSEYNSSRPAYALLDTVLRACVTEGRKPLGNGFQSLYDRTNMQDFVLQFGFRRVYCDLQVFYRDTLGLAIRALFPFRRVIDRLPSRSPLPAVQSLLAQEEIRRSCVGER